MSMERQQENSRIIPPNQFEIITIQVSADLNKSCRIITQVLLSPALRDMQIA